jgi:hypothetical protein
MTEAKPVDLVKHSLNLTRLIPRIFFKKNIILINKKKFIKVDFRSNNYAHQDKGGWLIMKYDFYWLSIIKDCIGYAIQHAVTSNEIN